MVLYGFVVKPYFHGSQSELQLRMNRWWLDNLVTLSI